MEDCNMNEEPWFTAEVLVRPNDPAGFIEWTEDITQDKYTITLPDNSTVNAKLFIDFQGVFDNGAYTSYLVNRFLENEG